MHEAVGEDSMRQLARTSSTEVLDRSQVAGSSPNVELLLSENAELKKRLQQERGMRQLYAKKLEEAEEEWLEQVEQLQAYVRSVRYTMTESSNSPQTPPGVETPMLAPETTGNVSPSGSRRSRSPLSHNESDRQQQMMTDLKELYTAKTNLLEDDVAFIREVKEGVSQAPEMDPERELQELIKKFKLWKREFKDQLKYAADSLKKRHKGRSSPGVGRSSRRGPSPVSPSSMDTALTGSEGDQAPSKKKKGGFMRRFLSLGKASH
ncbi:hypothetical protein BSKO_10978 [Bryopsis sp. KO-2023]|nr:hypothetical protein BSKO_10978 [Bryopsis sp. KO-2023]